MFNGPPPVVRVCASQEEEGAAVAAWLNERLGKGVLPHEIAFSCGLRSNWTA